MKINYNINNTGIADIPKIRNEAIFYPRANDYPTVCRMKKAPVSTLVPIYLGRFFGRDWDLESIRILIGEIALTV